MNALTNQATRTAVSVTGLRKAYGEKVVLDDVDLTIGEGEVFALLGPNGAGKTTIVRILSTLIPADAGTATVMGYDLRSEAGAVRGVIGVTGQFSAVDDLLTGEENLVLMGRLIHLQATERRARTSELLERFDLVEAARQTPATYSGGMKRRLDLAMTLMGRPRLIFLDEPTTGLDPRSRQTVWQIIRELVREGVTVLLTTQYLEEADHLADRIAVLDHGRIVAQGTPEELKRRIPGAHIRLRLADAASLAEAARLIAEGTRDDEKLVLRVPNEGGIRSLRDLLARLGDDVAVEDLSIHTPDLDDVFFAVTGNASKEKSQ
jgi:ABC-2 type transport system ATP-binding protein